MSSKKGQAAMEYLMTYGWALVALVVVIAALMATGAFDPSYLIAEECTLQPDLSCGGHVLYLEGDETILKFKVNNGLGYPIYITGVNITMSNQEMYDDYDLDPVGAEIDQGSSVIIEVPLGGYGATKGEIQRMKLSLNYISCAPEVLGSDGTCPENGVEHTVSGRIVARVEEAT